VSYLCYGVASAAQLPLCEMKSLIQKLFRCPLRKMIDASGVNTGVRRIAVLHLCPIVCRSSAKALQTSAIVRLFYYNTREKYYNRRHFTLNNSRSEVKIVSRKVISLSLPVDLLDRIDEYHLAAGYASLSEYIRELIRNDLRQNANESQERLNWRSNETRHRFTKPLKEW
jgi:Arc/MetJ-type ribon-helix-helix transcriptional regulator